MMSELAELVRVEVEAPLIIIQPTLRRVMEIAFGVPALQRPSPPPLLELDPRSAILTPKLDWFRVQLKKKPATTPVPEGIDGIGGKGPFQERLKFVP